MMNKKAYYITTKDLAAAGRAAIPSPLKSSDHLIYSSPAALAFNSPGAEGFGVKRAGLSIPGSVMLIVSPGCCGRNTSLVSRMPEYDGRFFYLNMEENDVVMGRHLNKIPQAAQEIIESLDSEPFVLMICITCVDALLGTDMERVCRRAEELVGIPVRPCYMYALTREGNRPPMVHIRQSLYSLLEPVKKKSTSVNVLGFFAPVDSECELFELLRAAGVSDIRQISTCDDYDEYLKMAEANFNIVLNPECRPAAGDMSERLDIPYIELRRMYDLDRLSRQYSAFSRAVGAELHFEKYVEAAVAAVNRLKEFQDSINLGVGECMNGDPFELSLALVREGFRVSEIYGTVTDENFVWIKHLADASPETKVYSNLEPTMIYYDSSQSDVTLTIGKDAMYYHPDASGIKWNSDVQPFGFVGTAKLYEALYEAAKGNKDEVTKGNLCEPMKGGLR